MITHTLANEKYTLSYIQQGSNIYFKAKDAALMLGYKDTVKTIKQHVDKHFKFKISDIYARGEGDSSLMDANTSDQSIFLSESGLYQLIFKSNMTKARGFTKWVAGEVLPSIRATGSYTIPKAIDNQFILRNERDLHYKVVDFIKKHFKNAILVPGLGELQTTENLRIESYMKGYTGGQPDILILNLHKFYNGLALELKTPSGLGVLSQKQASYLDALKLNNYHTVVSCDYNEIILEITKYFLDVRLLCLHCRKLFKSQSTLDTHYKKTHTDPIII